MGGLVWEEGSWKKVFECPIFSVRKALSRSPRGALRECTVIDAPNFVIVIPLLRSPRGDEFVMVRQWRHGSGSLSLEFPGGVMEPGENPEDAARRELLEETGYAAGRLSKLGEFGSNPATMSNRAYFFLAEDIEDTGTRNLDADEFVDVEIVSAGEAIRGMGRPPYIHALMGSAVGLYLGNR